VLQDAKLILEVRGQVEELFRADPTLEKNSHLAESLARQDQERQANLAKG
jgi:uridylate kinase